MLTNEQETMIDANIDKMMGLFGDRIILFDSIFSICHRYADYLTDAQLDDV